jgi:hypothetical protein
MAEQSSSDECECGSSRDVLPSAAKRRELRTFVAQSGGCSSVLPRLIGDCGTVYGFC